MNSVLIIYTARADCIIIYTYTHVQAYCLCNTHIILRVIKISVLIRFVFYTLHSFDFETGFSIVIFFNNFRFNMINKTVDQTGAGCAQSKRNYRSTKIEYRLHNNKRSHCTCVCIVRIVIGNDSMLLVHHFCGVPACTYYV